MHIEPFGVEIWMNEFETKCELNLAERCVEEAYVRIGYANPTAVLKEGLARVTGFLAGQQARKARSA